VVDNLSIPITKISRSATSNYVPPSKPEIYTQESCYQNFCLTVFSTHDKLSPVYQTFWKRRLVFYGEYSIGRCLQTICVGAPPFSGIVSIPFDSTATGVPMPVAFYLRSAKPNLK
jgi:hypothetical protein